MPFAGYTDFDECVAKNQDKDDPKAFCGWLKHQIEGATEHPALTLSYRDRLAALIDLARTCANGADSEGCDGGGRDPHEWRASRTTGVTQVHDGTVETWYNKAEKSYVTQSKDAQGHQIGDADYSGTKEGARLNHQDHIAAATARKGPGDLPRHFAAWEPLIELARTCANGADTHGCSGDDGKLPKRATVIPAGVKFSIAGETKPRLFLYNPKTRQTVFSEPGGSRADSSHAETLQNAYRGSFKRRLAMEGAVYDQYTVHGELRQTGQDRTQQLLVIAAPSDDEAETSDVINGMMEHLLQSGVSPDTLVHIYGDDRWKSLPVNKRVSIADGWPHLVHRKLSTPWRERVDAACTRVNCPDEAGGTLTERPDAASPAHLRMVGRIVDDLIARHGADWFDQLGILAATGRLKAIMDGTIELTSHERDLIALLRHGLTLLREAGKPVPTPEQLRWTGLTDAQIEEALAPDTTDLACTYVNCPEDEKADEAHGPTTPSRLSESRGKLALALDEAKRTIAGDQPMSEARKTIKAHVATELASRLSDADIGGLRKLFDLGANAPASEVASTFVRQWAKSSGDSKLHSVVIQSVAKDVFGLDEANTDHLGPDKGDPANEDDEPSEDQKRFNDAVGVMKADPAIQSGVTAALKAQYAMTQEFLKSQGITELTLARGLSDRLSDFTGDPEDTITMQPLSSFTTNVELAHSYAVERTLRDAGGDPEELDDLESQGIVMAIRVPAKDIFSTSVTGVGAHNENEVVVLGRTRQAYVHEIEWRERGDTVTPRPFNPDRFWNTADRILAKYHLAQGRRPINIDRDHENADWVKAVGVDLACTYVNCPELEGASDTAASGREITPAAHTEATEKAQAFVDYLNARVVNPQWKERFTSSRALYTRSQSEMSPVELRASRFQAEYGVAAVAMYDQVGPDHDRVVAIGTAHAPLPRFLPSGVYTIIEDPTPRLVGGATQHQWYDTQTNQFVNDADRDGMLREIVARTGLSVTPGTNVEPEHAEAIAEQARTMGFPPSRIILKNYERTFEVGGRQFQEGGHYSPASGTVTIQTGQLFGANKETVQALIAHEITHDAFHAVYDRAIETGGRAELIPEVHEFFDYLVANKGSLASKDGVTDYSRAYWDKWQAVGQELMKKPVEARWPSEEKALKDAETSAVNETLAEIAALRTGGRTAMPRGVDPQWIGLYEKLEKAYAAMNARWDKMRGSPAA